MKTLLLLASSLVLNFGPCASAAEPGDEFRPPENAGPGLQRGNDGPWNHRVLLATSKDGLTWTVGSEVLAEHASVPELFLGPDGKPIVLFVNASGTATRGALGAMVQQADGSWARRETNLRGADSNVVRLKDGSYRGYTKDREGVIIVFSSRDGLDWERLGVAFQDERYRNATDADVFETPDGWVALISLGPRMLRCTSADGLRFTTAGEVLDLGGSVSDTVKVEGGWRTFFHVNATPQHGGKMRVRSAFTADGKTWKVEDGDRVLAPASGPAQFGVADPAPMQLKDGSWLMVLKSFIERSSTGPQFAGRAGFGQRPDNQAGGESRPPLVQGDGERRGENFQPPGGGGGPREHQVHSATSKDGLTWTRDEGVRLMSASVPCVINDGDKRILLYAVRPPDEPGGIGGVACAVSTDGTNFKIESAFRIEGLSTRSAADPSIVKDGDGKFRLYYLASDHRGDPAHGANPHKINYALSDDGIRFRETGTAFEYDDLVDPDVFRFKDTWFMYVFARGGTIIATSPDGKRFKYSRVMSPPNWGTVAPIALPDGRLRLYAFEQRVPVSNAVGSFISTDGFNWTAEPGQRLKANAGEQITDPFVIPWRGGYKMYFKHSPVRMRNVAANAPQNLGGQNDPRRNEPRDGVSQNPPPAPNDFAPKPPPQNFNADGPWNRDVIAYRVSSSGEVEKAATFERAGVPTIARLKDGRLIVAHQHFPENDRENFDKVAVHFSSDDGTTWTAPQVIQVAGLPEGMRFPFDPTLVPLPDGRVRLYFTGNMGRTFQRSTPAIHSAISADGVNYTYEPGVRFNVEGRMIIDCAVALHAGVFHLFVPDNGVGLGAGQRPGDEPMADRPREGVGYHATSTDGLNFTRVDDVKIEGRRRWLGNAESDGKLITFYGTGEGFNTSGGGRPRGAFWMATSEDGQIWKLVENPPIGGGDPGAVKTRDGGLLVVITGESRVRAGGGRGDLEPRQNPDTERGPPDPQPRRGSGGQIRVEKIESKYKAAPGAKPGAFVTGQEADLMLGGFGFNNTGGALHFNHPTGLATDGKALLMTDRWNNRVLIWKSAPEKNTPPDLVLGQPDFTQNNPGTGKHQMNWPGNVAITPDGKRIAVTDTNNDRILIWNSFPTMNGAAADVIIELAQLPGSGAPNQTEPGNVQRADRESGAPRRPQVGRGIQRFGWPWGVWTDGRKFAVVATHGHAVLIWNSLPTRDNQPPDFVLNPSDAGTPRNVTSDGNWFAVSDHNNGEASRPATMVWRTFPTSATQPPDFKWNEWLKGSFTTDGRLVLGGMQSVYLWNKPPQDTKTDAAVVLRPKTYRNGDGPDAVVANGRLYVCTYNGNHILGWNALPTRDEQPPDFSIGSDKIDQDTWAENFFIQNAVVATDGKSLFVSSDFDRKMFVWKNLPDESAAKPDMVFHLPEGPWDNELHGTTLALAGRNTVYIWRKLPLSGEQPDVTLAGSIGGTRLGEITGVAFDDKYFYLSDRRAEAIYVWEGIPTRDSEVKFTIPMRSPGRLTSDGKYLCAAPFEGSGIQLWRVGELSSRAEPIALGGRGQFNLPSECLIADGRLFVCNRSFNRVDVWNRVEDALAGRPADALLGATDEQDRKPGIGRDQLFMPGSLTWGGGYLWVGEFKFSTRILRFSPQAAGARPSGAHQQSASPAEASISTARLYER